MAGEEEELPPYRFELAKTSRAICKKSGKEIAKGAIKVGVLNKKTGGFTGVCGKLLA